QVEEAVSKYLSLVGAAPADPPAAEPALVNNNTETMDALAVAPAGPAVAPAELPHAAKNSEDPLVAAAPDQAAGAVCPRRRASVKQRLMNSVSPAALLVGETPMKTAPVALPQAPLASAA